MNTNNVDNNINDTLPTEIMWCILSKLPLIDKFKMQLVCTQWCDILKDVVNNCNYKEISDTLQIERVINENHMGDPDYAWYLKPKNVSENLCMKVGWKVLEYSMLAEEDYEFVIDNKKRIIVENMTIVNNELGQQITESVKSVVSTYALAKALSDANRNLLLILQKRFVETTLDLFYNEYNIRFTPEQVGADNAQMPVLLVSSEPETNGDIFLEFTLNDPNIFLPHDYKMCYETYEVVPESEPEPLNQNKYGKWSGLGDHWELMDPLDILKLFWDETKNEYRLTYNNEASSSVSYLFEFIVYASYKNMKNGPPNF